MARPYADESALVSALIRREDRAFEQLFRTYAGRLLAVARRVIGTECDAEDVVQEAFLNAYRSIDRFEGRSQLGTWLHRITVNVALSKRRARTGERSIDTLLPTFYEDGHRQNPVRAWHDSVEELADRASIREGLLAALAALPSEYRDVVLLRDVEGLDNEQAAAALGLTVAATKTRLHRARQAMRTVIEETLSGVVS